MEFKNNLYLERGPFDLIAVMDESVDAKPYTQFGILIDLFDPTLPVLDVKTVQPGEQAFLFNVNRVEDKNKPQVLAAASRVYEEQRSKNSYSFITKSPAQTNNVMRVLLPAQPKKSDYKRPGRKYNPRCRFSVGSGK